MTEKFQLSQGQANTDTWRRLRAHTEARLVALRKDAEKLDLPERDRLIILARIDELKRFLALETVPDT